MSCYRCTKPFSIFNKEYGCKNCGFSVCSKCLSHKIAVPKLDNKVEKVCGTCFKSLSNPSKPDKPPSPPANFKRRLEASSNKPETLNSVQTRPKPKVDKNADLHARLNNLKKVSKETPPSTDEIRKRLDVLRARTDNVNEENPPSQNATNNGPFPSSPPKSQEDQIRDLINRYKEEDRLDNPNRSDLPSDVNIQIPPATDDSDLNDTNALMKQAATDLERQAKKELEELKKDEEIRKQLAAVRGKNVKNLTDEHSDDEDDEAKTQKLIAQILAQDKLDARFEKDFSGFQPPEPNSLSRIIGATSSQPIKSQFEEEDAMIWCCICNEDAILRCGGCDDDLYCKRCYREGHSRADYADHRTVPIKKV